MSINVQSMNVIAQEYFDAYLKKPLNTEKAVTCFERILDVNFIFSATISNGNNPPIQNEGGKQDYIKDIREMHFDNVEEIVSRIPEEYLPSENPNEVVCKVNTIQKRKGLGLNEHKIEGYYNLTATVILTFIEDNKDVKISRITQPDYTKKFLGTQLGSLEELGEAITDRCFSLKI